MNKHQVLYGNTKEDEQHLDNDGDLDDEITANSTFFKYKSRLLKDSSRNCGQ